VRETSFVRDESEMRHKIKRKAADVNDRSSPLREREKERFLRPKLCGDKITPAEKRLAIERKRGIVN